MRRLPLARALRTAALVLADIAFVVLCSSAAHALAAHAYAQFGDIKYPAGFSHFEWVNPNAPKGGDLDLVPPLRITNFDKYNPFTLKGTAPPGLNGLVFETLLTGTLDEPTTSYGLLADDIQVAPDRLAVTFHINSAARFHNGKPVTAADVKHSFDTLMSKQAAPQYRVVFNEVARAVVTARVRSCRCSSAVGFRYSAVNGAPASLSTKWSWIFRSRADPTASDVSISGATSRTTATRITGHAI
jgi:ABC-type oligopeptide transport system substrate-binding subunit